MSMRPSGCREPPCFLQVVSFFLIVSKLGASDRIKSIIVLKDEFPPYKKSSVEKSPGLSRNSEDSH